MAAAEVDVAGVGTRYDDATETGGLGGFQPWQGILESKCLVRAQLEAGQRLQIQIGSRLRVRHCVACDHMSESIEDPELAQIGQHGLAA